MRHVPRERLHLIIPPMIEENEELKPAFQNIAGLCAALYEEMVNNHNIALEDARFILPIGTETQIVMTCNFRQWLHVLKMRLYKNAQWEIRNVMEEIWKQLRQISPNIFHPKYREYWE